MKPYEFRARMKRVEGDAEHYFAFDEQGHRVSILYRPDLEPERPWGLQFLGGGAMTWHESEEAAAAAAREAAHA